MFLLPSTRVFSRLALSATAVLSFSLLAAAPAAAELSEAGSYFLSRDTPQEDDLYGFASASGDFNNDGFDDLAIGMPTVDLNGFEDAGQVEIFFGSSLGLVEASLELSQDDALVGTECGTPGLDDRFGEALAVGDFNNDGFDDLAVGAPDEDVATAGGVLPRAGAVAVFFGRADATFDAGPCLVYGLGGLPGEEDDRSQFGAALAVGDFEGDGIDDLAVGAPGATVSGIGLAGAVVVVYSQANSPLDPATAQLWHQDVDGIDGTPKQQDAFGSALATGDLILGQEAACDLAIGVPGETVTETSQGSVQVLFGCTANGLGSEDAVSYTTPDFGDLIPEEGDRMGLGLAIGNFDCDSADDLAIGVPGRDGELPSEGAVWVVYGNQLVNPRFAAFTANEAGAGTLNFEGFGLGLTAINLGNACTDLLIPSAGLFIGNNARYNGFRTLVGRPGVGLVASEARAYSLPEEIFTGSTELGASTASGRFDGAQHAVAVGAPGATVEGVDDAGVLWVLPSATIFADGFEDGDLSAWDSVVQ